MSKERSSNKPLIEKLRQLFHVVNPVRAPRRLKRKILFMAAEHNRRPHRKTSVVFSADPADRGPAPQSPN